MSGASLFFLSASVRALKRRQRALREQDDSHGCDQGQHLLSVLIIFVIYFFLVDLFARPRYGRNARGGKVRR